MRYQIRHTFKTDADTFWNKVFFDTEYNSALFEKHRIEATVKSRQKKPWSVFRKMEAKALSFEQLSDLYGFRVIVDSAEDCYRALGAIHLTWAMVPGRFKDYISTPKQNGYQSIHTTIVGPSRQRVELQIRTASMNKVAEYGVAAHSLYKDGVAKGNGAPFWPMAPSWAR